MPWKVKKLRKIGPFWFASSKASGSEEVVDLRATSRHRTGRPLFGAGRDTAAGTRPDAPPRRTGTHAARR